MKTLDTALAAHLQARVGITAHVLVWIEARDRLTGNLSPFGIWTGDDDRTFTVDGSPRTYLGAGSLLDVGELVAETGYVVRMARLSLAHLAAPIAAKLAEVNVRLQRVSWHQVHLQSGSHDLVAPPRLVFKGRVERMSLPDGAQGKDVAAEIEMASYAREMTRPLALKKSDEALQARHPGDRFRRYIAVSGRITVKWGEGDSGKDSAPYIPVIGTLQTPVGKR